MLKSDAVDNSTIVEERDPASPIHIIGTGIPRTRVGAVMNGELELAHGSVHRNSNVHCIRKDGRIGIADTRSRRAMMNVS